MLTRIDCAALLMILATGPGHAQQATELYIPIGASPGVSQTSSIIGQIVATEPGQQVLTLKDASGTTSVTVPDQAPVWLDRSKANGRNAVGSRSDLKEGATVEVKYREAVRGASVVAEWIKVQAGD